MYCQHCGHALPDGSRTCPSCHSRVGFSNPSAVSLDQVVAEAKMAAKDLAVVTARIARRVAAKADRAAKDPSGSARRGARRLAKELDKARIEIEKILNDL